MPYQTAPDRCSVVIDGTARREWTQVLNQFEDASIYQTWEYGEVRWGAKNLSRLLVRDRDGGVVAAAQVRVVRVPLLGTGVAYVTYGPMWRPRTGERSIANFRAALRALIDEYAIARNLLLRVRPHGYLETDGDMEAALRDEGFRAAEGAHGSQRRTVVLDLRPSPEELRAKVRKEWRRLLRRAEGAGLDIIEGYDGAGFEMFKPLFRETVERKKFRPGSDVDEFARMQEQLDADQRMRLTISRSGGVPVAGSVCSGIGDTVIGLLAATGQAGRELRAYYLLQWDEILWSKAAGKVFYDFGGINAATNPGVYHFKTGFGGREVTYLGLYDVGRNGLFHRAATGLETLLRWRNTLLTRGPQGARADGVAGKPECTRQRAGTPAASRDDGGATAQAGTSPAPSRASRPL